MSSPRTSEELEKQKHRKMMTEGIGCKVRVIAPSGKSQLGEVRIQNFSPRERLFRALKFLGICWGLGLVSVFIPIAHFFLVPGLFLAGLVISYLAYGTESLVLGGESICPNCGEFLPIVRGKEKWPLTDLCGKCRTQVTIEKA
jgi:hypothetical protein